MDLYHGAVGFNQVHDFNPGIRPSRLFWIQPIDEDSLDVDLEEGTATLSVSKLEETDYTTLKNSLTGGSGVPGSVSMKLKWTATGSQMTVVRHDQGFRGKFRFANATLEWSAKAPHFEFVSDPASSSNVVSVLGSERNGVFFNSERNGNSD